MLRLSRFLLLVGFTATSLVVACSGGDDAGGAEAEPASHEEEEDAATLRDAAKDRISSDVATDTPSADASPDAKPSDAKPSDAKPSDAKADTNPSDAFVADSKPSDAAADAWDGGPVALGCSSDGWCATKLSNKDLGGVWGSSSTNVWVVGDDQGIFRYNGTSWSTVMPPVEPAKDLYQVWGSGPNDIWAVGNHIEMHWNGTAWDEFHNNGLVWSVFGTSATDVWVGDEFYTCHHAGWKIIGEVCPGTYPTAAAMWGDATNDYWMVQKWRPYVAHWNGSTWTEQQVAQESSGIWGSAPNDIWAVGVAGLLHYDGATWTKKAGIANTYPLAVSGTSKNDVWVVGALGDITHFNGTTWSKSVSGVTNRLEGVWAASAKEQWAVAEGGIVLHRKVP